MKKTLFILMAVAGAGVWSAGVTRGAPAASEGHRFGEWPAINAMIHDEKQKNLNVDDRDFLIEVWFKPLPKVWAKGSAANTLVSKKLGDRFAGFDFGYTPTSNLFLRVCDPARERESDLDISAACGIKDGEWAYAAAARLGDGLRLYKDGQRVKDAPGLKLGTLENRNLFNVGLGAGGSQAHCEIREVRFWRVKPGEQVDFDAIVAGHGRDPATVSAALAAKTDYSRWTFTPEGETVRDQGSNGNTLMYVPLGYHPKDEIAIKPFPKEPVGTTYFVDIAHPAATDANPGTLAKPFLTIPRGLKALRPGDVLHICKGRYFVKTTLLLPRGENGKPVTIEGEDGTVLTGAEPITGWEKLDGGLWTVRGWKGEYSAPIDVREWDARSHPGNILFAGADVMDYVTTRADLAPGSWNVEPVEGRGPKTIYLYPLPGMDPNATRMEISVSQGLMHLSEFNHVRNLHFTRAAGAMGIGGRGHRVENNRIDWMSGGLSFTGQDHVFRKNVMEWIGGIGGGGARLLFEDNVMRFCAWRILDGGWAGGAIKFIPGAVDHVLRGNEFAYNRTATVWYDSGNSGNLLEKNVMHDNQASGIFDEFNFGNTFRENVIYNNAGVIYLGNSCSDTVARNIGFNNLSGIGLRGATVDGRRQTDPAKVKAAVDEMMSKWDVRRYQGMLTWEREKPYRDMLLKYTTEYSDGEVCRHNTFVENVLFDNGNGGWEHTISRYPYGQPGVVVDPDAVNTYASNTYWCSAGRNTNAPGRGAADLAAWQKASGQEVGSRWANPWDKEQMPKWYRQRMASFSEGQFRPYTGIVALTGGDVRKFNPSRLLLRGRLAASKTLTVVDFEESAVRGAYFDAEGQRCLALWSRGGMGMMDWVLPAGQKRIVVENKWLNRSTVKAEDGRLSLLITEDPTVLVGISGELRANRSVVVQLPEYTQPGTPVAGKVRLENQGAVALPYELTVRGDGFASSVDRISRVVAPGASAEVDLRLTPRAGTGKGAYQVVLEGTVGGRPVRKTRGFVLGSRNVAPRAAIHVDGDLSDWDRAGIQAEVADTKEQVLVGKEAWGGAKDLSAKIRLARSDDYVFLIGVEVTDDKLVTTHRKDKPTESDSVQVFVDVRTPWKLYINDYGAGAFQLLIVPGTDDNPEPAIEFIGPMIAHQKRVATKKTATGYTVEASVRFRNMDEPGWVGGREFRVGALVNDCDDPAAGRKSVLSLWRTALDADRNCVSHTRFTLGD